MIADPPILEIVVETDAELNNNTLAVVKGSNLSLACNYQANPSIYELFWIHEVGTYHSYYLQIIRHHIFF